VACPSEHHHRQRSVKRRLPRHCGQQDRNPAIGMHVYACSAGLLRGADGASNVGLCVSGGTARHRQNTAERQEGRKSATLKKPLMMSAFPKGLTPGVCPHTDYPLAHACIALHRNGLFGSIAIPLCTMEPRGGAIYTKVHEIAAAAGTCVYTLSTWRGKRRAAREGSCARTRWPRCGALLETQAPP
jgi:hypothetical protein